MNFFDYELSRTATATPPQTAGEASTATEPSLNDEVTQVVGQLGKLWGGFRKQSQAALEVARKDFSSVVAQAQKEFEKLTTDIHVDSAANNESTISSASESQEPNLSMPERTALPSSTTVEEETTPQPSSPTAASSTSPFQFQTLLSRIQSSLPPNISETLERTIPAALKDPSSHAYADLAQLRATLGAEFARVQGVTRVQAEEYAHRSEALLREAGAYLKDAVRVIPPEDDDENEREADVVFDGMGVGVVVMPPTMRSGRPVAGRSKGKTRETPAQAQQRLAGSRVAALLAQLKRDPEMVKQDPSEDDSTMELYESWLTADVSPKDGGIESSYWAGRTKEALSNAEDGEVLAATRDKLVPSMIDSNTFWTRYFFRVHQIEKDEEKRKALLAASGDEGNDEDFSWEDDEDEDASATPSQSTGLDKSAISPSQLATGSLQDAHTSRDTLQPGTGGNGTTPASYPESLVTSPSNTSPRESSDGYDVVSPGSAAELKPKVTAGSKDVKESQVKPDKEKEKESEKDEDEADSDWE